MKNSNNYSDQSKRKMIRLFNLRKKTNKVLNIQVISLPPKPHKIWCLTPKLVNTPLLHDSKLTIKQLHKTPGLQVNHMFNETGRKQTLD